jgi:hypothetical protein
MMRDRSCAFALLVGPLLLILGLGMPARGAGMAMEMAKNTLLVAQLNGAQVAGGSRSHATGTAAFLLDPTTHGLTYSATYRGLDADRAGTIGLYNFGPGQNGKLVHVICGQGAAPCPTGRAATISGRIELDRGAMADRLISEFDTGRVYIEIADQSGLPEIRGQFAPNTAMAPTASYIAELRPAAGVDSRGTGTAVLSQVYLPGRKVAVFYAVTVANTSGQPTGVAVAGRAPGIAELMALPRSIEAATPTGGTLTNRFELPGAPRGTQAALTRRLRSLSTTTGTLIVITSRAPKGELYGTLMPIR